MQQPETVACVLVSPAAAAGITRSKNCDRELIKLLPYPTRTKRRKVWLTGRETRAYLGKILTDELSDGVCRERTTRQCRLHRILTRITNLKVYKHFWFKKKFQNNRRHCIYFALHDIIINIMPYHKTDSFL